MAWGADAKKTAELHSAEVGGGRYLMLTSWKALLDRIQDYGPDGETKADIRQLRGLTTHMDAEEFLPLQPDELGPEWALRLLGLGRLVDAATQRARREGWLSTKGLLQAAAAADGYGRWVSLGWTTAWFGISCNRWAVHHLTPLWLDFANGEVAKRRLLRDR